VWPLLVNQDPVTGHLEAKKRRSAVEIHDVHVSVNRPGERDFDVLSQGRRSRAERHADIQIAPKTVSPAGRRPENYQQLDAGKRGCDAPECFSHGRYSMSSV